MKCKDRLSHTYIIAGNLDQKIVEIIGDASSKVITSTGGTIHNTPISFNPWTLIVYL